MEKTQEGFANWTKSQVHSTIQGWLQCENNSLNIHVSPGMEEN